EPLAKVEQPPIIVIPAQAGIYKVLILQNILDPRFRGDDVIFAIIENHKDFCKWLISMPRIMKPNI
ncbi:MAG: hypothetical protein JW841_17400, partial [Deltaproteobacteria bacterium]|nr:hypothetical protein [Deltaproteobacteria bacterium]